MEIYNKLNSNYKKSMQSNDRILKYATRSIIGFLRDFVKEKYSKDTPDSKKYSNENLIKVIHASCKESIDLSKAFTSIKPRTDKVWESIDDITTILGLKMTFLPEDEIKNFENKYKKEIIDMAPGWVTPIPNDLDYLGKDYDKRESRKRGKVDNKETKGKHSVGTGFFVDGKGHIITNYHVVKDSNNNAKILYDHKEIDTNIIAYDENLDIALLKAEIKNKSFINFTNKSPQKAQSILVAGFPYGKFVSDDLKITSGIINSLKGIGNNSAMLQIDATINPGNSGGPIVDKLTGGLVGVATMKLSKDFTKQAFGQESENTNYGIKSSQVRDFLESNNIKISIKNSKFNISKIEEATVFITCN